MVVAAAAFVAATCTVAVTGGAVGVAATTLDITGVTGTVGNVTAVVGAGVTAGVVVGTGMLVTWMVTGIVSSAPNALAVAESCASIRTAVG